MSRPTLFRYLKQSATVRAGVVSRTGMPPSMRATTPSVRALPDHHTTCSGGHPSLGLRALRSMPSHTSEGFWVAGRAFVSGDSVSARRAYEIVLRPLWNGDIWLPAVDEFPDEVLTTSTYDACARLLVATYETAAADERVEAMIEAVELVDEAQQLCLPIRMMEHAAVRPLQGLDSFLPLWLERLRAMPSGLRDSKTNDLIREATLRVDGVDGLAQIARASKTQEAYDSWCRALREGQQWPELLAAVLDAAPRAQHRFALGGRAQRANRRHGRPPTAASRCAWDAGRPEDVGGLSARRSCVSGRIEQQYPRNKCLAFIRQGDRLDLFVQQIGIPCGNSSSPPPNKSARSFAGGARRDASPSSTSPPGSASARGACPRSKPTRPACLWTA